MPWTACREPACAMLECMTYLEERADGMGGETKEGRGREGRSPNLVYGSPGEYRGTTMFILICEAKGGKEPYCVCTWVHSRYVLPSTYVLYVLKHVRDQNRSVRSVRRIAVTAFFWPWKLIRRIPYTSHKSDIARLLLHTHRINQINSVTPPTPCQFHCAY